MNVLPTPTGPWRMTDWPASTKRNTARSEVLPVRRTGLLCGDAVTATVVEVLPVDGAVVVVRRVQPAGVEPALDPADQITTRIGSGGPAPAVSELSLHRAEPALGDRVVPTHPGRAHRLHDAVELAQLTEGS